MVKEQLTDGERHRLLQVVMDAIPQRVGDPELTALLAKLSGTDTVVIVRRSYPSRS